MDTSREAGLRPPKPTTAVHLYPLQARSLVVLMERRGTARKEESNEAPS
jgi:hypothetical protein